MTISVRSLCRPPVWELDEQAFQYSMNLTCQVSVKGEISADGYDYIAAFVGDECRGYAAVENMLILSEPYDSTWTDDRGISHTHTFVDTLINKYLGFMTVHSNTQSNEEVYFRLWDASECEEYYEIEQHLPFVSNSVHGNPETPLVLNATGAVAQFVTMDAGWTWFSVHLNHDDAWLDINHIFSHEDHFTSGDRIIHQSEFESYSESVGAWVPGMMRIDPREMYMAHLDTLTPVTFIGHEISPDSLEIILHPNWNWLGYPLRFNHSINEALQNLTPSDGSIIKSETQFAEYVESIGLWVGSLQWMTPGAGYLFENTGDSMSFTYSGLDADQSESLGRMVAGYTAEPVNSPWRLNQKAFRYNMPVVGVLEAGEWQPESIIVAALVGDEVRGIAAPVYDPALDEWRIYLMVHSNLLAGETVKFRVYDSEKGAEYFTNEIVSFNETGKAGSVIHPLQLTRANAVIPEDFVMQPNYPNPFNTETMVNIGVPIQSDVHLRVYDLLGREVATLLKGKLQPGYHSVIWQGRDDMGKAVASGVYFIVLESGGYQTVQKILMLK